MENSITQEFWEYQNQTKNINPKQKQYQQQKHNTLKQVLQNYKKHRRYIEKRDQDTYKTQHRKLKQIFREIGINIDNTTLEQFYKQNNKDQGIQKLLDNYKNFHIDRYNNKSIPQTEKLSWNSISNLITPLNPFFEKYLGLKIHITNPGKKPTYKPRTKLREINQILDYIDNKYKLKIKLADTPKKQTEYRKRWATERITISALKYIWTRGKEITEGNLTLKDITHMKKTSRIPLHTRKRQNQPLPFQQPVVPDDFLQEWDNYEQYRDTQNKDPDSPAIIQVNKQGKPITRKWIRRILRRYRRELDLPEHITPHNIRRSMHTLCRTMSPNRMIAQIQLGDISHKIADDHYNIPDTEMIKQELNRIYTTDNIPGETPTRMENIKNKVEEDRGYA